MDDTKERILATAQALIQRRGYNGFSYRDIAAEVGIRSASIHYHFPTKADLGAAVGARYLERFMDDLRSAEAEAPGTSALLARYVSLFRAALTDDGRMCLCGMLGAEMGSLPSEVALEARRFFEVNTEWLSNLLAQAGPDTGFETVSTPETEARLFLAALEGGMILAKAASDAAIFDEVADAALKRLVGT